MRASTAADQGAHGPRPPPQAGDTDAALVARARSGDLGAFERLVRRHQRPVYRLALRILDDPRDAEDVTQDVFVTAWRRMATVRDGAAIRAWLYRTTTNRCLNAVRSRSLAPPLEPWEAGGRLASPDSASPERQAQTEQCLAALRAAVRRLPPNQRACWVLREVEELSYAEIAKIIGATPHAVRGRISRARAKLAEEMQGWR